MGAEARTFIGRERELETLASLYDAGRFQFPVVYGRRRIGKTSLLSRFTDGRPAVFFTAVADSAAANLRNLSRAIHAFDHPDADPEAAPVYADFQSAFEAVFARAATTRLVFVIDEYPYLAQAEPSVSSVLQMLIDRNKDESLLYLVLCGSSLSFMKEQVLGEKSPLYGRRTAQIELSPFDFFDAARFFPDAAPELAALLFGVAGGVPLYLAEFDGGLGFAENLRKKVLNPASILFEEPTNLLQQEVQKAPLYNATLAAIANGKTTVNEIATTAGIQTAEASYYLKELQRIGLVRKITPIVAPRRRSYYAISDNLFRFWYRFVLSNRALIERRMADRTLLNIEAHLSEYMGRVFEDICASWLWRQNAAGKLTRGFDDLGTWWGANPKTRGEEEIDLVGVAAGKVVLAAECKWRNEPCRVDVVEKLCERAVIVGAEPSATRYVFSKSGFSQGCVKAAERSGVQLVAFADMAAFDGK